MQRRIPALARSVRVSIDAIAIQVDGGAGASKELRQI